MTPERAERAIGDVLAVETVAPGMVRVVTLSDTYVVDARDGGCRCPDKQYHGVPRCKHEHSAILATDDDLPTPWHTSDDLSGQNDTVLL